MQRNTRQRTAILETLSRQDDFRSAQQIHEQLRADGETVGLATVYRNLQALSRSGRLDVLVAGRSEEHTSELQSRFDIVCRLLLEKRKRKTINRHWNIKIDRV